MDGVSIKSNKSTIYISLKVNTMCTMCVPYGTQEGIKVLVSMSLESVTLKV